MSDWELYYPHQEQDEFADRSSKIKEDLSEWELYTPPEEKEHFLMSLLKSPFRIGEDVIKSGYEFAKGIPGYLEGAKTEVPGLFQTLTEHPGHLGMQGLAGANEAINKLAQLPKHLSQYGEERLNLIPHGVTETISKITPEDTTEAIQHLFSSPQYAGEELLRGTFRNIPELLGAGKVASMINPLQYTNKNIVKNILGKGEELQKQYGKTYENLWKEAENKGFGINNELGKKFGTPLDINFPAIKKYTPEKKIEGLADFIENPNLESAHFAKSDLKAIQRELDKKTTKNKAERKQSKAIADAISKIDKNMFVDQQGKISEALKNRYKEVQSGFRKEVLPYRNKSIQKFKNEEISAKKLVDQLREGPFAVKRGQFHPELKRQDALKKAIIGSGILGGAYGLKYGVPVLDELFRSKTEQNS